MARSRRRNEEEDSKGDEMYSFVTVAGDKSTKGKQTTVVDES